MNARAIEQSADRIFVALREETRAYPISNDDVAQLFDLADTLAAALHAGDDGDSREPHVTARARATLDAHRAATGDLHRAIACVRARVTELVR